MGSHPWLVSRRVGPGTDGRVSEHKRDFPPTGGPPWGFLTHGGGSHPWLVSRRVGKGFPTHGGSHPRGDFLTHGGISHPWGGFSPMACVKKGGSGDGWSRERTQKGFPTHGGGPPWGFLTHGGSFLPMGCVKKGGKGISHPRLDWTTGDLYHVTRECHPPVCVTSPRVCDIPPCV